MLFFYDFETEVMLHYDNYQQGGHNIKFYNFCGRFNVSSLSLIIKALNKILVGSILLSLPSRSSFHDKFKNTAHKQTFLISTSCLFSNGAQKVFFSLAQLCMLFSNIQSAQSIRHKFLQKQKHNAYDAHNAYKVK